MSKEHFLPFYAGLMVSFLIASLIIVDHDTPKYFLALLLISYSTFIVLYYWRRKKTVQSPQIHSLRDLKTQKPSQLAAFEKASSVLLREIGAKDSQGFEFQPSFPSFPSQYSNIRTLQQICRTRVGSERTFDIGAHYHNFGWKETIREALIAFEENFNTGKDCCSDPNAYKSVLARQSFRWENLIEAEDISRQFLMDRAKKYFIRVQSLMEEANLLLSRNFGIVLTKGDSTRPNAIRVEEFNNLVTNYFQSFTLPRKLLPRQSEQSTERDMMRLRAIMSQSSPLVVFPQGTFVPFLLLQILSGEFPGLEISINKSESKEGYILKLQMDFSMSWAHASKFRSWNAARLLTVFLATLAKQGRLENRILRTFRSFQE